MVLYDRVNGKIKSISRVVNETNKVLPINVLVEVKDVPKIVVGF